MDVIKVLPEYLDGLEDSELQGITRVVLMRQIQGLKESIAVQVVNARSATLMDDLDGSTKYLGQARKMKTQYLHFLAELKRLDAPEQETAEPPVGANHG